MLHKPGAPWGTIIERRPPEPGETWQCRGDKRFVTIIGIKDSIVNMRSIRSNKRTEICLADFHRRFRL